MQQNEPTSQSLADIGATLNQVVESEILPITTLLEDSFARLSRSIERELARAARQGALDFKEMVDNILLDLARLATNRLIRDPLENLFTGAVDKIFGPPPVGTPPIAPSLFSPEARAKPSSLGGKITQPTIIINMAQPSGGSAINASEGQITNMLTRALQRASRFS